MDVGSFVRILPEEARDLGGGTGYRIGPTKVLTAAHVVGEEGSPVRFLPRAHSEPTDGTVVYSLEKNEIDVAIVEHKAIAEDTSRPITYLARRPFVNNSDWQSQGWTSAAGTRKADAPLDGYGGRTYPFLEKDDHFHVTPSDSPKEIIRKIGTSEESFPDWFGISGAPVFVGGLIYGVIRRIDTGHDPNRLLASSTVHLIARDSSFRDHAGIKDSDERSERCKRRIEPWLTPSVVELLGRQRRFAGCDGEAMCDLLCATPALFDGADALDGAHQQAVEQKRWADAEHLELIAARVAPLSFWLSIAAPKTGDPTRLREAVPAAQLHLAELYLAAYDLGEAAYEAAERGEDPQPAFEQSAPALGTIDLDASDAEAQVLGSIAARLPVSKAKWRRVAGGSGPDDPFRPDDAYRYLNGQLKPTSSRPRRSYFAHSRDQKEQERLWIERIAARLTEAHMVETSADISIADEDEAFRPYRLLLERAQQRKKPG